MKKRIFCLILCAVTLFSLSARAAGGSFQRRVQYGALVSYENMAFGYSLGMYERFMMLPDETVGQLLDQMDAERTEGEDEVYDLRIWYSADGRYQFDVQIKEPTYASFEKEIEMAPEYLDLVRERYDEDQHVQQLHEGILRQTPAGTMLETAVSYDLYTQEGRAQNVVFLYYDLYMGDWEYCFSLTDCGGDYDSAQQMLDEVAQTIRLQPREVRL